MRIFYITAILVILLTACSPRIPTLEPDPSESISEVVISTDIATPTTAILLPEILSTPIAELIRFKGMGSSTSPTFTITEDTLVRLNWKNSGTEKFDITIYNMDPGEADPSYKQPTIELPYYSSEGIVEYYLVAGTYELLIDSVGGEWEVWLETATIPEME